MVEDVAEEVLPQHCPRWAEARHAPLVEECDPVGVGGREVEVVQHGDHRAARVGVGAGDSHHPLLVADVERRRRLVEEQDRRLLRQHARQSRPAALSTRERRIGASAEVEGLRPTHRALNRRAVVFAAAVAMRMATHHDDLTNRERELEHGLLRHHRAESGALVVVYLSERPAVELDGAVRGHELACEQPEKGRLAGAVRPCERKHLARGELDVDAVDERPVVHLVRQVDAAEADAHPQPP